MFEVSQYPERIPALQNVNERVTCICVIWRTDDMLKHIEDNGTKRNTNESDEG